MSKFFEKYMEAAKGGQIIGLTMVKTLKLRKSYLKDFPNAEIVKQSSFRCRVGVEYDNMKAVKEKRESGELPSENQGLPWGVWETYPYSILHKEERYLRVSKAAGDVVESAVYWLNGKEITKEEAMVIALASEFADKSDTDVFSIKESNIAEMRMGGTTITA